MSFAQAKKARPFQRILLAVDRSQRTEKAISTAAEVARESNALRHQDAHRLTRADGNVCGLGGVIVLELVGSEDSYNKMAARLAAIPGVEIQRMVFNHQA